MSVRWSDANTVHFINSYRAQECLWNFKMDTYTNRLVRDEAASKIVADMEKHNILMSILDVKAKIRSLRTLYRREALNVYDAAQQGHIYEPQLFWYKMADAFLKNVVGMKGGQAKSADPLTLTTVKEETAISDNLLVNANFDDINKSNETVFISEATTSGYPDSNSKSVRKATSTSSNSQKRPHNTSQKRSAASGNQPGNVVLLTSRNSAGGEDEFDLFGRSIAAQLRRMPLLRATRLQSKLQNMVSEERVAIVEEQKRKAHHGESM